MEANLRYPVGKFERPEHLTGDERRVLIDSIAEAPARLAIAVVDLNPTQLDTPYRPGGWTVRQVVHHLADSHMNAYIRCKLALTEDDPTIKTYEEALWAELADSKAPLDASLPLIENLHARWVLLLRSLSRTDWERRFRHPNLGTMTVGQNLAHYEWHGRHHIAHITSLRERREWNEQSC
ncbi:MAG TPA: bacillithiol transferase BstA [Candidatus Acidoferrales bacterium]|nr:bacillithiol transferase BstA [Candidatus Acidoferrales bacterium]